MIPEFLIQVSKLHKRILLLSIGNLVSITVDGEKEPTFIIPCTSPQSADALLDNIDSYCVKNQVALA